MKIEHSIKSKIFIVSLIIPIFLCLFLWLVGFFAKPFSSPIYSTTSDKMYGNEGTSYMFLVVPAHGPFRSSLTYEYAYNIVSPWPINSIDKLDNKKFYVGTIKIGDVLETLGNSSKLESYNFYKMKVNYYKFCLFIENLLKVVKWDFMIYGLGILFILYWFGIRLNRLFFYLWWYSFWPVLGILGFHRIYDTNFMQLKNVWGFVSLYMDKYYSNDMYENVLPALILLGCIVIPVALYELFRNIIPKYKKETNNTQKGETKMNTKKTSIKKGLGGLGSFVTASITTFTFWMYQSIAEAEGIVTEIDGVATTFGSLLTGPVAKTIGGVLVIVAVIQLIQRNWSAGIGLMIAAILLVKLGGLMAMFGGS